MWKLELIFLTVYESESWDAYSIDLTSDASKFHADPIFTHAAAKCKSVWRIFYTQRTPRGGIHEVLLREKSAFFSLS